MRGRWGTGVQDAYRVVAEYGPDAWRTHQVFGPYATKGAARGVARRLERDYRRPNSVKIERLVGHWEEVPS